MVEQPQAHSPAQKIANPNQNTTRCHATPERVAGTKNKAIRRHKALVSRGAGTAPPRWGRGVDVAVENRRVGHRVGHRVHVLAARLRGRRRTAGRRRADAGSRVHAARPEPAGVHRQVGGCAIVAHTRHGRKEPQLSTATRDSTHGGTESVPLLEPGSRRGGQVPGAGHSAGRGIGTELGRELARELDGTLTHGEDGKCCEVHLGAI